MIFAGVGGILTKVTEGIEEIGSRTGVLLASFISADTAMFPMCIGKQFPLASVHIREALLL